MLDYNESVIIEKRRHAATIVVSSERLELLMKEKERAFGVVDRVQVKNAGQDPNEVLWDVTEAVEEVRKEPYAKRP
jgi:hypothetical protein